MPRSLTARRVLLLPIGMTPHFGYKRCGSSVVSTDLFVTVSPYPPACPQRRLAVVSYAT